MTAQEEIDLFEQDNKLPESVCSGHRWNISRGQYDICTHMDECEKYNRFKKCNILDDYNKLNFVKYHYLPSFKKCNLYEQSEIQN